MTTQVGINFKNASDKDVLQTCSETKMLKGFAKSRNDSITVLTDTQRNLGKSVRLPSHPTSRGLDTSFPLHTRVLEMIIQMIFKAIVDVHRGLVLQQNGDLCISILHPPVDDPQSGELPCERWNPTQNVRTILLSVISLLNEPNTYSPANVDASVMYRRWRDSKGKDKEYENIIRKQAQAAKMEAEKEGIVVPVTLEDYCIKTHARPAEQQLDMTDFYDDEYELDDDDDDEQMSASDYEDGDDSDEISHPSPLIYHSSLILVCVISQSEISRNENNEFYDSEFQLSAKIK
ncbi:Ubiquitin-conjugating enzyme E2 R1 [Melipona quadrifasciata]|uniref:Ubiquitin-conjugating enzyme E2 R1 n=1 Tax=Melipona quadrifasciata TaxID=166423 RepID=A0A0N0BCX9_9HYME|nr:Ubiquitin-conjugating enzyme E2 R1 [Melipona quadrifasciata]